MYFKLPIYATFRFATANDVKTEIQKRFGTTLSNSTIKHLRRSFGYEATKPKFVPHIRENNKLKRKEFCQSLVTTVIILMMLFLLMRAAFNWEIIGKLLFQK